MGNFFWFGTLLGFVIGCAHFAQILISRLSGNELNFSKTVWHALWVLALWTLFGSYVLLLWLAGILLLVTYRALYRDRQTQ